MAPTSSRGPETRPASGEDPDRGSEGGDRRLQLPGLPQPTREVVEDGRLLVPALAVATSDGSHPGQDQGDRGPAHAAQGTHRRHRGRAQPRPSGVVQLLSVGQFVPPVLPGSTTTSMSAWRWLIARSARSGDADGVECTRRHGSPDWASSPSPGWSAISAPRQRPHEHRRRPVLGKTECPECAVRRFVVSPTQSGGTGGRFLGHWLIWTRKREETRACQESGGRPETSRAARRKTRVIWPKLDCLKPNL